VGLTRILLLVGDILSGDRGLRNDEFASWPVQGIWKCVSGAVYTDVDLWRWLYDEVEVLLPCGKK
jgi:hypothetical protein